MADMQKLVSQVEAQRKKCEQEKNKLEKLENKLALEQTKEFTQLIKKYNITDLSELSQALSDWHDKQQEKENENE